MQNQYIQSPLTLSIQYSHTDYTDLHCSKLLPMFSLGKYLQKGLDWIVSFVLARVGGCWRLRTCNISVTEGSSNGVTMCC